MAHRVLADVNVCLDVLLDRKPFIEYSGRIFEEAEKGTLDLLISGISFDTLFYIMRPSIGVKRATELLQLLCVEVDIGIIDGKVVQQAVDAGWNDLEDALQYFCAVENGCDYLITRDEKGFKSTGRKIEVVSPKVFIEQII